jgi:hypothetical protein
VAKLPAKNAAYLTGHTFFPSLISAPFSRGLTLAFYFAIAACLIAAVASLLRGGKYVHGIDPVPVGRRGAKSATTPVAVTIPAANGESSQRAAVGKAAVERAAVGQAAVEQAAGSRRDRSPADMP